MMLGTFLESLVSKGGRELVFRRLEEVADGFLLFGHPTFENDEVLALDFSISQFSPSPGFRNLQIKPWSFRFLKSVLFNYF